MDDLIQTLHRIDRGQSAELFLMIVICVLLCIIAFKRGR